LARRLSRRAHPEVAAGEWGSRPIGRWCSPWQASATGLDRYRGNRPGLMDRLGSAITESLFGRDATIREFARLTGADTVVSVLHPKR
jgi:hypothetical protein